MSSVFWLAQPLDDSSKPSARVAPSGTSIPNHFRKREMISRIAAPADTCSPCESLSICVSS